ncbi:MAG: F0F1 ATP synthase subunit B [Lachnospiraceae bacterium]|nr:F0F1 ATP synthase subunit B [Lachnospiraceae bacterium]
MDLMSINWVTVIANVVNVLVFFALMKHFLFKPVNEIMEKRQALIQGDLDDAANQKEEATKLKTEYEASIQDAKQEAADIIDKAKKTSAREHDEAIAKTQEETAKMIADAKESIEADKEKAMLGLRQEIASIAMAAATQVINKNIDEEANKKYLDDFLGEAGGK